MKSNESNSIHSLTWIISKRKRGKEKFFAAKYSIKQDKAEIEFEDEKGNSAAIEDEFIVVQPTILFIISLFADFTG